MPSEPLSRPRTRVALRSLLAAAYLGIGVVHVTRPDAFLPIMPDWVPDPRDVVLATGACEIAGAVALMTPRLRRAAGWAFAAYAVCVFPANIKHAMENIDVPPIPSSWWYHGPRLAFQPVFVWWALWATGVTDWPFTGTRGVTRRGDRPPRDRAGLGTPKAEADHG